MCLATTAPYPQSRTGTKSSGCKTVGLKSGMKSVFILLKGGAPAYNDVFSKKVVSLIFCLGSEISSEMSFWWSEHPWNSNIFWCQNSVQTMSKQCPNNVQTMSEQVWTLFGHQNFLEIEFQGCADYQNSFLSLDKFRNEFLITSYTDNDRRETFPNIVKVLYY